MEVDIIVFFYVLKGQVNRFKDDRTGTIFVKTHFLLNKIKIKLKNKHF